MVPQMSVGQLLDLMEVKYFKVSKSEVQGDETASSKKVKSAFDILMEANRAYNHLPEKKM